MIWGRPVSIAIGRKWRAIIRRLRAINWRLGAIHWRLGAKMSRLRGAMIAIVVGSLFPADASQLANREDETNCKDDQQDCPPFHPLGSAFLSTERKESKRLKCRHKQVAGQLDCQYQVREVER